MLFLHMVCLTVALTLKFSLRITSFRLALATHRQRKAKPRNGTNAMEPNAMAMAATKRGEIEMKTIFPKRAIWTKPLRSRLIKTTNFVICYKINCAILMP
jgi:hypothetical protein